MRSWVTDSLNEESRIQAQTEASLRLLRSALGMLPLEDGEDNLRFTAEALDLAVVDLLDDLDAAGDLRLTSSDAFQLFRVLRRPSDPVEAAKHCLRTACFGVLGDKGADVSRWLKADPWPQLPLKSDNWGTRTLASILDSWLCLLRKDGWEDLDRVQTRTAAMRNQQQEFEREYLASHDPHSLGGRAAAWELVAIYHLAKAADLLATFTTEGQADGSFDIRQQLEAQFDRVLSACHRGGLIEWESLSQLLSRVGQQLITNCIWSVARSAPEQMIAFVREIMARGRGKPIFDLLPPQRRTLTEAGLLGRGHRSVVVSLPTSSGKTFIAEFRILQALNQFTSQRGWVAYLAPTRTLVNQIFRKLRRDFEALHINVERVSPALEVDESEIRTLTDSGDATQFNVLVTTPEKLDLLIRGGWEARIGRPLTLTIVDEAHNLAQKERGIRLELLLSTINRECRHAQFLLLTPFIANAAEIARWLDPQDNQDITLSMDWQPNDRIVVLSHPRKAGSGRFFIDIEPVDTSKTVFVPQSFALRDSDRYLGLTYSQVKASPAKMAAATAEVLGTRGSVIVLANKPESAWRIAGYFKHPSNYRRSVSEEVKLVQRYLEHEFGADFTLIELLRYGVGVHHSGLPDEVRELMEWLLEEGHIQILVATTTVAQGVNFPISAVVLASHQYPLSQYPFWQDMPPEDFWNVAGRAGRVDQGGLGIVALACPDQAKASELRRFAQWQSVALASSLTRMVEEALRNWKTLNLHDLVFQQPEWSAFLQFLAHTYRQVRSHRDFSHEVEQVLRGTLGFQELRRSAPHLARQLLDEVDKYSERIKGRPLSLVDSTGWSWDSISSAMLRLSEDRVTASVWDPRALFGQDITNLRSLMGILLAVPELRENLKEATGGDSPDGTKLANMVSDWVNGASLSDMALRYFNDDDGSDITTALTKCCRSIYGKLTQTASWGLAALQTITLGDTLDRMPEQERLTIRNLPSRVLYGVASDDAVALRLVGTPRNAAQPLADILGSKVISTPLPSLRSALLEGDGELWRRAMGSRGSDYYHVWQILCGKA